MDDIAKSEKDWIKIVEQKWRKTESFLANLESTLSIHKEKFNSPVSNWESQLFCKTFLKSWLTCHDYEDKTRL